ncbi:MAG TPA: hypothetical protein VF771_12350 [Longimicrobiaceae bacterium]
MRFTRATLLVAATAVLAACQDTPTTTNQTQPQGTEKFQWYTQSQADARGIKQVGHEKGILGADNGPRFMLPPCDLDCTELPWADYDYGSYTSTSTDYYYKYVQLHSYSNTYSDIDSFRLTVYYDVIGAESGSLCSNVPAQYDYDPTQYGYGSPASLSGARYASYNYSAKFVWRVRGSHYFYASAGYSVDGYYRSKTFSSRASVCY